MSCTALRSSAQPSNGCTRSAAAFDAPGGSLHHLGTSPWPATRPDIAAQDWGLLFDAVKWRLRGSVGAPTSGQVGATPDRVPSDVRSSVLECVEALDKLQASALHAVRHRQQRETLLADAHAMLAQMRAQRDEARTQAARAQHLALHDGLTALPTGNFFREHLEQALARAREQQRPLAVLYLDLDGFKQVNDSQGHDIGDEMLRAVAARLRHSIRKDDMASRLGGDEFACLFADVPDTEHLVQRVRRLYRSLSSPLSIGPIRLPVRASIGVAVAPADGATADTLLKTADAAMYRAKRHRSGYAFSSRLALV